MPTSASNMGREDIIRALREELLGPAPAGTPLTSFTFATKEDSYGPWISAETGEEILERKPLVRYGVGVLFPASSVNNTEITNQTVVAGLAADTGGDCGEVRTGTWQGPEEGMRDSSDDADFELSGANDRRPTAMGVSFLLAAESEGGFKVEAKGGRYSPVRIEVPGKTQQTTRTWWERTPVKAVWNVAGMHSQQSTHTYRDLEPVDAESAGLKGLSLRLTVNFRRYSSGILTTVALVNRSNPESKVMDSRCLFQSEMTVTPEKGWIEPYPEASTAGAHDDDESFRLIYRHAQTYAVGHGCSANWGDADSEGRSWWVKADPLPAYETPSITPDIELDDGSPLTVSMAQLAGLEPGGMAQLESVLAEYERWIGKRKADAASLNSSVRITADRHMIECTRALERMREGLEMVRDPESGEGRAFRLANEAMLKQQVRSSAKRRTTEIVDGRNKVSGTQPDEAAAAKAGRGRWRAFQVAFLLAAIPSTSDPAHEDREAVDLIFFPTGGGKTEAYLGLSAFAMLLRRLRDPNDVGVTVLMRYTLRLLTAQQFLRAAGLICALDRIWEREYGAASERFSIGIWVGGETTPNRHVDAKAALNRLSNGDENNPFLLLRCPWCAAQMGPVKSVDSSGRATGGQYRRGRGRSSNNASGSGSAGYESRNEQVVFLCPDQECDFSSFDRPLPVYVVDEDLYQHRPSLVIGTVDKFAQLAWNPNARALFGIGDSGERRWSPPELVIQDELHLIAGPLGSMTGLYEGLIEELCTDHRGGRGVLPKIVASTATIRRHEEQIRALYARETVHLFPPHGIDASDSFFAVYARDRQTRELLPGRKYIGVHAPALGSMQTTQVRSFAALLQAAKDTDEENRDPWWTLMAFFNSLRELGNSLSLMQSDIPDYLKTINNRSSSDRTVLRYLNQVDEMTSRLRQDQIPEAMEKLEKTVQDGNAIDVCLASSLIEVGIDIDRLSLMAVVGQPKSTSQYIQVTGRVGRKWDKRPGLVLALYGAGKPRDRSHFERFRTYHQRLYAQVEPTSATPFAPSALDRALHAVVVAYIRQTSDRSLKPYPFPDGYFSRAEELVRARVAICDPKEASRVDSVLKRLRTEWENWQPSEWGTPGGSAEQGDLLRSAGQYADPDIEQSTWPTSSSMRGVDAECQTEITPRYAIDGGKQK